MSSADMPEGRPTWLVGRPSFYLAAWSSWCGAPRAIAGLLREPGVARYVVRSRSISVAHAVVNDVRDRRDAGRHSTRRDSTAHVDGHYDRTVEQCRQPVSVPVNSVAVVNGLSWNVVRESVHSKPD